MKMNCISWGVSLMAMAVAFASQASAYGTGDSCTCKFPRAIQLVHGEYVCRACPYGFEPVAHLIAGYEQGTCECQAPRIAFDGRCVSDYWCTHGGGVGTAACNALLPTVPATPVHDHDHDHDHDYVHTGKHGGGYKASGKHTPGKWWCINGGGVGTEECRGFNGGHDDHHDDYNHAKYNGKNKGSRKHTPGKWWCINGGGVGTEECRDFAGGHNDHHDDHHDDYAHSYHH